MDMAHAANSVGLETDDQKAAPFFDPDAVVKTLGLLAALRFDAWRVETEWAVFVPAVFAGYALLTALTQSLAQGC